MGEIAYWTISVIFCAAWAVTTTTAYRTGWHRVSPWFARWLAAQTIQATITTVAGTKMSLWWAQHIWAPGETIALLALCIALAEILPRRMGLLLLIAAVVLAPVYQALQPPAPGWLSMFASVRAWIWATTAAALWLHIALLLIHPLRLAPGAFRVWIILAVYATAITILTPLGATGSEWLSTRVIYREVSIVCCLLWIRLSAEWRRAAREPDDPPAIERRAVADYSWVPAPRLVRGPA